MARRFGFRMWPTSWTPRRIIRTAGYMDGTRAVFIIIFRQPGANIIQTVDRIRSAIAVS